eukprot:1143962-Pelagomonas_calceolata.AAC.1
MRLPRLRLLHESRLFGIDAPVLFFGARTARHGVCKGHDGGRAPVHDLLEPLWQPAQAVLRLRPATKASVLSLPVYLVLRLHPAIKVVSRWKDVVALRPKLLADYILPQIWGSAGGYTGTHTCSQRLIPRFFVLKSFPLFGCARPEQNNYYSLSESETEVENQSRYGPQHPCAFNGHVRRCEEFVRDCWAELHALKSGDSSTGGHGVSAPAGAPGRYALLMHLLCLFEHALVNGATVERCLRIYDGAL